MHETNVSKLAFIVYIVSIRRVAVTARPQNVAPARRASVRHRPASRRIPWSSPEDTACPLPGPSVAQRTRGRQATDEEVRWHDQLRDEGRAAGCQDLRPSMTISFCIYIIHCCIGFVQIPNIILFLAVKTFWRSVKLWPSYSKSKALKKVSRLLDKSRHSVSQKNDHFAVKYLSQKSTDFNTFWYKILNKLCISKLSTSLKNVAILPST